MPFAREAVAQLLMHCHRRCCVCHRFCGVKMETDHIVPTAQGGSDDIDNAIPVCFECHAEIHSYNDKHPRGRKFTPDELRAHKKQWLSICQSRPEVLVNAYREIDVGPLQALIDELEFNLAVADAESDGELGCLFLQGQFLRAIQHGSIATLRDDVRTAVIDAYRAIGSANPAIAAAMQQPVGLPMTTMRKEARKHLLAAKPKIYEAKTRLLAFLSNAT